MTTSEMARAAFYEQTIYL